MRSSTPFRFLLTLATLGTQACDSSDSSQALTAPRSGLVEGRVQPTVGVGFPAIGTALRGNVGAFRLQTNYDKFNTQLHAQDNADIVLVNAVGNVGGHSGWHYHPGPAFVVVKTGALTAYRADDPTCTGKVYPAGTVIIEGTVPHIIRNEGSVASELGVVFIVPAGTAQRIDAPAPGTCPF
jgi:quercetin dioxygenase-like cupin family protein